MTLYLGLVVFCFCVALHDFCTSIFCRMELLLERSYVAARELAEKKHVMRVSVLQLSKKAVNGMNSAFLSLESLMNLQEFSSKFPVFLKFCMLCILW